MGESSEKKEKGKNQGRGKLLMKGDAAECPVHLQKRMERECGGASGHGHLSALEGTS